MKDNIRGIMKALINAYICGYDYDARVEEGPSYHYDRDDMYDCIKSNIRDLDLIESVEEDTELSNLIFQLINEETGYLDE